MKKIIFILALFCSFIANAQYIPPIGYTNINSRYDWLAGLFRALGLPAGGTAAFTAGQAQRAGSPYYDSTGTDAGLYIWTGSTWQSQTGPPVSGASSGILSGGVLTINADPTKFNIASGTGFIANSLAQTVIPVSWSTQTGLTVTNLLTAIATYILIDNTGTIVQQTTAPTPQQIRSHIYIGKLAHTTMTAILFAITEPSRMFDPVGQIHDLNSAIGPVNINEGNIISANGANLNINVSAGSTYRPGANYVTARDNPSLTTESAGTAITFRRKYRNGSGGWTAVTTMLIDPDNYDDGDGTLAAVPNNKFTIQTSWRFGGSGTVHIDYGQKVYNTIAEARIGISEDTRIKDPDNVRDAVLRGWIIVKQGTTALNSTTDAVFIAAGKFGESAVGTSGVSTLQSAYNNSVTPQITTSTGLGSVDFKRGSAADTDPVLKIMNGAGTAVTTLSGNGAINATLSAAVGDKEMRYNTSTGLVTYADTSAIEPNLIVDSIGIAGTDVIIARNDSLLHRLIATGYNYVLVDTLSTGEIRIRLDTASATFKAYISANSGGSGTINSGNQYRIAYYATTGTILSEAAAITASRALVSDANGVPTHATTTTTQVNYLSGASGTTGTINLAYSDAPTFTTNLNIPDGSGTVASLKFNNGGSGNLGFFRSGSNLVGFSVGSTEYYRFSSSSGFVAGSGAYLGLGSTVASPDVRLNRDAAAILSLKNSTNAQEFRIYNTDATDDEYVSMGFLNTANVFTVETEKTGSGVIRDIEIKSGTADTRITKLAGSGTRLVTADASGNLATKSLVTLTKNINLPSPTAAENEFIFFTPVAITITNTRVVLVGSASPSITYNIAFGVDRTSLTNVYTAGQTVTSTTTGTDASGVNDNTIPANSWVVLTTSAQSGVITSFNGSIQFTED